MNSTDFRDIIGAGMTAADRQPKQRHLAKGGRAQSVPKGKPHHLTIIIAPPAPAAQPNPIIGALMHAMILHHLRKQQQQQRGALQAPPGGAR